MRKLFVSAALLLGLCSGCAALGDIDWVKVGQEVAKGTVAAVASHNEDFAEILEKNSLTPGDVSSMIDASAAVVKGEFSTALGVGLDALSSKIPGTPNGPPMPKDPENRTPWEMYGLVALIAGERIQKGLKDRKKKDA